MTALECDGYPVFAANITAPNIGAWYAEIETSAPVATGDNVTLEGEGAELVGTVLTGGAGTSRTYARIVGGSSGTSSVIDAHNWKNATAGKILKDLCGYGSETASTGIKGGVLSASRQFWSQPKGTLGGALQSLAASGDWVWRVEKGGAVWMGDPDEAVPLDDLVVLQPYPETLSFVTGPETYDLWVGKSQQGSAVKRVEYNLGDGGLRCEYWLT